jgi:hypothetical protein
MTGSKSQTRSARAWELAEKQHGLVTRQDLLKLSFSAKAIECRIASGRLHTVSRGVYAVGWPKLTDRRRWMAAVLACNPGATLSHRSAAALWGIGRELRGPVDVSVRRRCAPRRAGIHARSRPSLPPDDVVLREWIPVTTPVRTLLDLATEIGPGPLERAVNEADKRDVVNPEALRGSLGRYVGEPGVRILRRLLDKHTFQLSDSDLEIIFRRIAISAGLPPPLGKEIVNGFEVDFHWPELGLVVETDGLRYHRTPAAQARDHVRDQTHAAAGLTPLRFTHYQVKYEPAYVREILSKVTRR